MTTSEPRPPAPGTAPDEEPRDPRWWPRALIVLVVVAMLAMWSYALFGPRSDPPGTLDDASFSRAAEPVCAETLAAVRGLPLAHETTDPVRRAEVIETANGLLDDQIRTLRPLAPGTGEDARRVGEWLTDWRTYLDDRVDYAERLRNDPDARLLETEKDGNHISEALEFFAEINEMPSCAPPGDVA